MAEAVTSNKYDVFCAEVHLYHFMYATRHVMCVLLKI